MERRRREPQSCPGRERKKQRDKEGGPPGAMPNCSYCGCWRRAPGGLSPPPPHTHTHATGLPGPQPRGGASPRSPPFHSAPPYSGSAEYLRSLPSSKPDRHGREPCSGSRTLGRHRASIPGLSTGDDESSSGSRGGLAGNDVRTCAEGLARADRSTGAANISLGAPASTATVIISGGINIPAGNGLQGHRAPDVTERQTRRPGAARGRAGVRTHFGVLVRP